MMLCPNRFNVRSEFFCLFFLPHVVCKMKNSSTEKGNLFAFNVFSVKSVFRLSSGILVKVLFSFL